MSQSDIIPILLIAISFLLFIFLTSYKDIPSYKDMNGTRRT